MHVWAAFVALSVQRLSALFSIGAYSPLWERCELYKAAVALRLPHRCANCAMAAIYVWVGKHTGCSYLRYGH